MALGDASETQGSCRRSRLAAGAAAAPPGAVGNATLPAAQCQGHGPSLLEQNLAGQGAGGPGDAQRALFCLSKGKGVVVLSDLLAPATFMHVVSSS